MSEPQIENFTKPTFDDMINNRITQEQRDQWEEQDRLHKIEQAKKDAEKLRQRCQKSYEYFYENSAYLPTEAVNRKIEELKKENNELFQMLSKWDTFGEFGFCICGPVGTGKTYALTAILNLVTTTLAEAGHLVAGNVMWRPSSMLLEELKNSFNENESILKKIEKLQDVRFLFIDDIGAHKITEFDIDKLISILDYRVNKKFPTFFSTNCKIDQMKSTFGERIFSRIIATSVMVEIKGKDRRLDIHAERLKQLRGET